MASSSAITLNDGTSILILAYGTATALIRKDAKDWVKMAYNDAELRHIDTAAYYENEDTVGAALKELGTSREEIFITTKCKSIAPLMITSAIGGKLSILCNRWQGHYASAVSGEIAEAGSHLSPLMHQV